MLQRLIDSFRRPKAALLPVPEGQNLYKCWLHGTDCPGGLISISDPIGFFTTRYVVAPDADTAEAPAIDMLKADPILHGPTGGNWASEARVHAASITQVPPDTPPIPNAGYTFYVMGT